MILDATVHRCPTYLNRVCWAGWQKLTLAQSSRKTPWPQLKTNLTKRCWKIENGLAGHSTEQQVRAAATVEREIWCIDPS